MENQHFFVFFLGGGGCNISDNTLICLLIYVVNLHKNLDFEGQTRQLDFCFFFIIIILKDNKAVGSWIVVVFWGFNFFLSPPQLQSPKARCADV